MWEEDESVAWLRRDIRGERAPISRRMDSLGREEHEPYGIPNILHEGWNALVAVPLKEWGRSGEPP